MISIQPPVNKPLSLAWYPEAEYAYYPVDAYWLENNLTEEGVYNSEYFHKYETYTENEVGKKLNKARVHWVEKILCSTGNVLDVGIGSGTFVSSSKRYFGFDVNPAGIEWLKKENKFKDLYSKTHFPTITAYTFWDSLEHIKDMTTVIENGPKYIFVSIPIFRDLEDILKSKHYRKDEHHHYFTKKGFVDFMKHFKYNLIDFSNFENDCGREGIGSFAFVRS